MRLQHGLRADSPWIDPEKKDFDPQAVIRQFRQWQYEPFVKFILDVKRQPLEHPYYQERLAMLKAWVDTGAYRKILERSANPSDGQLIEVVKIQAFELADEGQTVDPYVIVMDGDRQVLRTRYASACSRGRVERIQVNGCGGRTATSIPERAAAFLRDLGSKLCDGHIHRRLRDLPGRARRQAQRSWRIHRRVHREDPLGLERSHKQSQGPDTPGFRSNSPYGRQKHLSRIRRRRANEASKQVRTGHTRRSRQCLSVAAETADRERPVLSSRTRIRPHRAVRRRSQRTSLLLNRKADGIGELPPGQSLWAQETLVACNASKKARRTLVSRAPSGRESRSRVEPRLL